MDAAPSQNGWPLQATKTSWSLLGFLELNSWAPQPSPMRSSPTKWGAIGGIGRSTSPHLLGPCL